MQRGTFGAVIFSTLLAACGGSSGTSIPHGDVGGNSTSQDPTSPASSGGGQGTGQAPTTSPTSPPPPGGLLTITAVTLDRSSLTAGQQVTIDVTINDPAGAADIAGGVLLPTSGTTPVVTFVRQGTGSTFEAKADITAFNAVQHITVAPSATAHRQFDVHFTDAAGHAADKSIGLDFTGQATGICNGGTVGSFYQDCSSCDTPCTGGTTCLGNVCSTRADCGFAAYSCNDICGDQKQTCLGVVAVSYTSDDDMSTAFSTCADQDKSSFVFSAAACAQTTAGDVVRGCYCQ